MVADLALEIALTLTGRGGMKAAKKLIDDLIFAAPDIIAGIDAFKEFLDLAAIDVAKLVSGNGRRGPPPGQPDGRAAARRARPYRPVPHELTEVTQIDATGYPKNEGRPSTPDETAMEVHGDTAYVATFTGTFAHLTAVNLTDGETVWQQDVPM